MNKYFKGLSKNTFFLAFNSLFADISTEMVYPILPIFLTQELGVGGAVVGLVDGISTATGYIGQGISGWLSDKFQKRKFLAIFGYVLGAAARPIIGLSANWPQALGARFFDRLGSGIRSAPRDALIAGSVDGSRRGKAFGLEGVGDNLGAFFGPIFAVALLFYFKVDLRNIFFLSLIPGVISVLLVFLVKETPANIKPKYKLHLNFSVFPKSYYRYLMVTAVFGLGNIGASFMILQTKYIGVSLIGTILIFAFYNLIAAFVSFPVGTLSDKFGRKKILIACFAVLGLVLFGFTGAKSGTIIALLFALYGVFQGIFRAVGKAYASDFVKEEHQASAIGWYNSVVGISGLLGSIIAGQIYDRLGHATVFATALIFVSFGTFFLLYLRDSSSLTNKASLVE